MKLNPEQRRRAQALVDSPAFDEPDDVAFELIWLRDEVARLGRAVAAGAGDPQGSKDQQRGDPQEGDLCTAVRRYLSYIADVRSGRVKHLDRGVVLNYAQDMERHL